MAEDSDFDLGPMEGIVHANPKVPMFILTKGHRLDYMVWLLSLLKLRRISFGRSRTFSHANGARPRPRSLDPFGVWAFSLGPKGD
jgi:hypothetical protein